MTANTKVRSFMKEHLEYAYLHLASKDIFTVINNPNYPGWRRLPSGQRSWTDEYNLIFTLDRLDHEYGHTIYYKKSTNTMLVVLTPQFKKVANRFRSVSSMIQNRNEVHASIEADCKESLWYMTKLLDKNDNWMTAIMRKIVKLFGYKDAMPKPRIVMTGFREAGSVAEYVACRLGLEAVTFSSCGLPPCKKIHEKSKITRYAFSPNVANTFYSYEHGNTYYLSENDPTVFWHGLFSRYRPNNGDILALNEKKDEKAYLKKAGEHNLPTGSLNFYQEHIFPLVWRLIRGATEYEGEVEECYEPCHYRAQRRITVSKNIVELGIRCAHATMKGMITALIFEQNPKLVTYWPKLLECMNERNPDKLNELIEVEPAELSM